LSGGIKLPEFNKDTNKQENYNPLDNNQNPEQDVKETNKGSKNLKIFIIDKSGDIRSVNRTCDMSVENSCFEYAIKELLSSPSKWEKSKGFTSEIPQGTKLLSVRESSGSILLDLSSDFETGGGAESTYMRIKQIIKTVNSNSAKPVYLYINGKQANVIGGEGVMLKQPLNERSLDE
jgi:spore germination protein GerM